MKGIVPDDILEALKKKKLGLPGIDVEAPPERNALIMGEFEVILELIAANPEAKVYVTSVLSNSCYPRLLEDAEHFLYLTNIYIFQQLLWTLSTPLLNRNIDFDYILPLDSRSPRPRLTS